MVPSADYADLRRFENKAIPFIEQPVIRVMCNQMINYLKATKLSVWLLR
jgi:hypothetical protein